MVKDGTARGGTRVGAGRKPNALVDKILEGRAPDPVVLESGDELVGVDVPPVKDYLTAPQKNGKDLCAAEVFKEIYSWLKGRGCEKLVSRQLIEQYTMSVSRWVQCEEAISAYGFLAKHPTTGNAIASPYVSMFQQFMKQSSRLMRLRWDTKTYGQSLGANEGSL